MCDCHVRRLFCIARDAESDLLAAVGELSTVDDLRREAARRRRRRLEHQVVRRLLIEGDLGLRAAVEELDVRSALGLRGVLRRDAGQADGRRRTESDDAALQRLREERVLEVVRHAVAGLTGRHAELDVVDSRGRSGRLYDAANFGNAKNAELSPFVLERSALTAAVSISRSFIARNSSCAK